MDFRVHDARPLGGGEDATYFMRRVQERGGKSLYFLLGGSTPTGHHTSTFDVDERALAHGALLMAGMVLRLTGSGRKRPEPSFGGSRIQGGAGRGDRAWHPPHPPDSGFRRNDGSLNRCIHDDHA